MSLEETSARRKKRKYEIYKQYSLAVKHFCTVFAVKALVIHQVGQRCLPEVTKKCKGSSYKGGACMDGQLNTSETTSTHYHKITLVQRLKTKEVQHRKKIKTKIKLAASSFKMISVFYDVCTFVTM